MKKLEWNVVHECDDDQGNPTQWATTLEDGTFLWIDKTNRGYVLTDAADPSVQPIGEYKTLAKAKKIAEKYSMC